MCHIFTDTFGKATPNKFLDSHPNFEKKMGGWDFFLYFLSYYYFDCFKEQNGTEAKLLIPLN